jgi:hypothetical protein
VSDTWNWVLIRNDHTLYWNPVIVPPIAPGDDLASLVGRTVEAAFADGFGPRILGEVTIVGFDRRGGDTDGWLALKVEHAW